MGIQFSLLNCTCNETGLDTTPTPELNLPAAGLQPAGLAPRREPRQAVSGLSCDRPAAFFSFDNWVIVLMFSLPVSPHSF
ncbi:MAG TPA: hypothetical protein VKM36_06760 [Balneolaceae bacterium]|nr:hypothetical protein [Balneolaceae bacterium]